MRYLATAASAALSAVALSACEGNRAVEPRLTTPRALDVTATADPVYQLTGGYSIGVKKDRPSDQISFQRISFEAMGQPGATKLGEFEVVDLISSESPAAQDHGDILCFRVIEPNRAAIVGIITRSTSPENVGLGVDWGIADQGEGANEPPDLSSPMFRGVDVTYNCPFPTDEVLRELTAVDGNIQVRQMQP